MLVTVGKTRAARLFGTVFPRVPLVRAHAARVGINAENAVIIADSGEINAQNALAVIIPEDFRGALSRGGAVPVVTCGAGSKNTVCVTSLTPERITLSLNRTLRTASGLCEPLEAPFERTGGFSLFDYAAAFAASLILS